MFSLLISLLAKRAFNDFHIQLALLYGSRKHQLIRKVAKRLSQMQMLAERRQGGGLIETLKILTGHSDDMTSSGEVELPRLEGII